MLQFISLVGWLDIKWECQLSEGKGEVTLTRCNMQDKRPRHRAENTPLWSKKFSVIKIIYSCDKLK